MRRGLAGLLIAGSLLLPARAEHHYSDSYTQAAQAVLARRYVDARTIAEGMLLEDPESFEAHSVLGQVHLRGEEDLGLAAYHLQQARDLLEARFPPPLAEGGPLALHQEILRNLRLVAYLSQDYETSLGLIADYNRLYDPDLDHLRGWPLMKLGRFGEAEAAVKAAQKNRPEEDPAQVDLWDTLGQLAYEQQRLPEAAEQFQAAALLESDTADQPDPVYLTNLGEVQRDQLSFEQAEATWREATDWRHPGSYAEPHQRLACLLAGQGRLEEAYAELEQAVAWRAELWPQVAAHTRASHLTSVGEVLLAAGDASRALEVMERALGTPHRQALSSERSEILLAKRYLLASTAHELAARQAEETRSWSSGADWWRAGRTAFEHQLKAAWARSQAAIRLTSAHDLEASLRPYGPGAMQCPWLLPRLAAALGPAATQLALPDQQSTENFSGEAYRGLLGMPEKAMLPESETLARARGLARGGEWAEALRLDPSVARRENLSLGVAVQGPEEVADRLYASPRFHPGGPLVLTVDAARAAVLKDEQGQVLAQVAALPDAAGLVAALHQALFRRPTEWTAQRLDALTREASPGRMASARLEQMLGGSLEAP